MSDVDRSEQAECVGGSLVAVTPMAPWLDRRPSTRPDPTFVTQLIANAEQVPQASHLRRATPADAQLAYSVRLPPARKGFKTEQVV